jgi:hypothetical protein
MLFCFGVIYCAHPSLYSMFVPRAAALGADWVAVTGVRWEQPGEETRASRLMLPWCSCANVRRVSGYFGTWQYSGVKGVVRRGGGHGEDVGRGGRGEEMLRDGQLAVGRGTV